MRRGLVAGLILAVLAFAAWRLAGHPRASRAPLAMAADTASAGLKAVQIYFASPNTDSLVSETRELVEAATLHERVAALVREMDRGPTHGGVAVLPAGTSVAFAYLDENGLLILDLARSFVQGLQS